MKLCVAAQKMRRFITTIPDAVSAAMGATRRLSFLQAVVALSARSRGCPRHPVANLERLPIPVLLQSISELFDTADRFVSEDNRQRDRQFALPQMHIRPA